MAQNEAVPTSEPLAVDVEEELQDEDSALNLSITDSTESITSNIHQYRLENGRTYHAYKDGKYLVPNDSAESERLDIQHHLCSLTFDGKLYTCPAGRDKQIHRVLDAGCGTGIWSMDFADEHPEAHVIGVDLSPIQPTYVPPNLTFEVDDIEEPWTYTSKFDFIYGRMLTGSVSNWPRFMEQSYEHLNPGGWIELSDLLLPIRCDDGTITPESPIHKWGELLIQAADVFKRPLDSPLHYKEQLEAAGFVNVSVRMYKWPQNQWPKDSKYKELGMWCLHDLCGGIQGLSLAALTRGLGWTVEETEVFLAEVRKDFKNPRMHGWFPIYVVYAQKPE